MFCSAISLFLVDAYRLIKLYMPVHVVVAVVVIHLFFLFVSLNWPHQNATHRKDTKRNSSDIVDLMFVCQIQTNTADERQIASLAAFLCLSFVHGTCYIGRKNPRTTFLTVYCSEFYAKHINTVISHRLVKRIF